MGTKIRTVPKDQFISAPVKDKINTDTQLKLILPDAQGNINVDLDFNDESF